MLTGLELTFMCVTQCYSGLFSTPGFLVSPSDLSMSSIFGLRSSYMLEYRWLFALLLRSARYFTGVEGKWTLLPPISPPSSHSEWGFLSSKSSGSSSREGRMFIWCTKYSATPWRQNPSLYGCMSKSVIPLSRILGDFEICVLVRTFLESLG